MAMFGIRKPLVPAVDLPAIIPTRIVNMDVWHYRYYCFIRKLYGFKTTPEKVTSICPYFHACVWGTLGAMLLAPFWFPTWLITKMFVRVYQIFDRPLRWFEKWNPRWVESIDGLFAAPEEPDTKPHALDKLAENLIINGFMLGLAYLVAAIAIGAVIADSGVDVPLIILATVACTSIGSLNRIASSLSSQRMNASVLARSKVIVISSSTPAPSFRGPTLLFGLLKVIMPPSVSSQVTCVAPLPLSVNVNVDPDVVLKTNMAALEVSTLNGLTQPENIQVLTTVEAPALLIAGITCELLLENIQSTNLVDTAAFISIVDKRLVLSSVSHAKLQ